MPHEEEVPLIVTLELNEARQQYFNRLRQAHFPAERNFLEAHLTLFHHLPGEEIDAVTRTLERISEEQPPLALSVGEVKSIGRGVAFVLTNDRLRELHRQLQQQWADWLTPQDRQKLWPHITVQNKVTAEEAKATLRTISEDFEPFTAEGTGLQLWKYRGGPWEFVRTFPFRNAEKSYLSS